jgi:NAD(P)-dependent dehydrogenase (short-subunit alcohol dehydrogenase family)
VKLARAGFQVFAGVRREDDMKDLEQLGLNVQPVLLDVTDRAAIDRLALKLDAEVGEAGLAGLVNSAGVSGGGPLEVVDLELVRRCFEVNVMGILEVTQALLPMLRRSPGRIVNIGSAVGRIATPLMGPYCISKFGVEAVSDVMRLELHHFGVSVSVIEPGSTSTPMIHKGNRQIDESIENFPKDAPEYYLHGLIKLRDVFDRVPLADPDAVADLIVSAMTVARPRSRYVVGNDAKLLLLLKSLVSERALDALLRRIVDL